MKSLIATGKRRENKIDWKTKMTEKEITLAQLIRSNDGNGLGKSLGSSPIVTSGEKRKERRSKKRQRERERKNALLHVILDAM